MTFTDLKPATRIARISEEIAPQVPTIIRTRDDTRLDYLLEQGADEVIPDTVESSMMLARHTLAAVGQPGSAIIALLEEARRDNYAPIRAYFHGSEHDTLGNQGAHYLRSIEIVDSYFAVGRTLESLGKTQKVRIVSLRRQDIVTEDPPPDTELRQGDVIVLEGHPDAIQAAEIEIMSGR